MHRIVTKVKALLIRSGRAFAPSYISVGSRNYSVIIVKAIHQSSFFHRSCRILNATYLVSFTEFLLFVLTRRGWRKKKKKNFKRKNKKSSRKESEISLSCWFFLSLFFFLLLKSTLISGNSGKIGRGIGSRSQIFTRQAELSHQFSSPLLRRGWSPRYFRPTTGWKPRMFACYPLVTIRRRGENRRSLYPAITGKPCCVYIAIITV